MENAILNFLLQKENYYLSDNKEIEIKDVGQILQKDLILYHIDEIAFDEQASMKESIENILTSIKIEGINFLYLVISNMDGVNFYLGLVKDLYYDKEMTLGIEEMGEYILKPSIKGNIIGSKISELASEEKKKIQESIDEMEYFSVVEGVPGIKEKDEDYTGTLSNVMDRDTYGFMTILTPLNVDEILNIEDNLIKLYTLMSSLEISDVQESVSNSSTESIASSTGESLTNVISASVTIQQSLDEEKGGNTSADVSGTKEKSETAQGNNKNNQSNKNITTSNSNQHGTSIGENWGKTVGQSININPGYAKSNTTDSSITEVYAATQGTSTTTNVKTTNKEVEGWMKYIDDVLLPRLDYGKGRGMFNTSTFLFTKEKRTMKKLENIIGLLFAGETGNKIPVKAIALNKDSNKTDVYKKFQLPHGNLIKEKGINNPLARSAISQYLDDKGTLTLANWLSTKELGSIIAFSQKEVNVLNLNKLEKFSTNVSDNIKVEDIIYCMEIIKKLLKKR